jgi:formate dehydrogenase subunit gamma
MVVCIVTAAFLYIPELGELIGRRRLVEVVHEWCGIMLPAPFLLGLASRPFRKDLHRLNRFIPQDKVWLRAAMTRHPGRRPAGKFNAGQKLYASWIAGVTLVMLGTGVLMWFTGLSSVVWRTSATFIHDWLALAIGIVVIGHIAKAVQDPEARRGMRTGSVLKKWAKREHPLWKDED